MSEGVRERARRELVASERVIRPAQEDPFVRGVSQLIGGPPGEHAAPEPPARRGAFWTAARIVLALTCLVLALHWIQKSPCRDGAWQDLSQYKNFCYTDVLALYGAEKLNEGKVPYLGHGPDDPGPEYPVLTGAFMGLVGLPIHALGERNPGLNQFQAFYDMTASFLIVFAVATAAMLLALRRRRPWDVVLFALSPALLLTATVNWDFLAIMLAVGGLLLWSKSAKPWPALLAGMLLGLGAAAKLWPVFLLGPIVVLAIRHRDYLRMGLVTGGTVVTWLIVNVPIMVLNYENWHKFLKLNTERPIDWGTSWYVLRHLDQQVFFDMMPELWGSTPLVTNLSLMLFALCCVGVAALGLFAKQPPRLAQLAFLVVALFLITNKVWSQQFVLWLIPLLVLARPKWGAFLAWQLAEVGYFFAFYGQLMGASGEQVIPEGTFVFAALLRLAMVTMLVAMVVREILRPELDVVRQTYGTDPDSPPVLRSG